jgi:NNP family nitrate/nitrite transporter-like MFS transporter
VTTQPDEAVLTAPATARKNRWIEQWNPEDRGLWDGGAARIARRNLIVSILTEHVGFSVWSLWSVFVLFLTPAYGISHDLKTAAAEKFLLTTLPTAVGAVLRLPYTLAVARFGGRNWTVISALLLLIPTVAAAIVLQPGVSYGTLLVIAAFAGVGGGNFASSMANINSFYPQRLKGRVLGLNAGGGNIGVAVVQLIGLLVLATAGKAHPRVMLGIYIPLVVIVTACAALFMDNIAHVRNEKRAMRSAAREPHTWVIAFLYIGTFGSFIGFGFAFGQVLQNQFAAHFMTAGKVDPVKVAYLSFLGPLIGSLIRPAGGWLADRVGGAITTFWNFLAMAAATGLVLVASEQKSLVLFYIGFVLLFALSGFGNGSTYKMIPAIFRAKASRAVDGGASADAEEHNARRITNAVIGIAAAVGAFGGVLVNIAFRQSFLSSGTGNGAYLGFIAFYLVAMALTWVVYLRPRPARLPGI